MHKKSFIILTLLFLGISGIHSASADNVPPSTNPPGGLLPEQVPQFVNWGFDDNYGTDGIRFILDYFKNKTNPSGNGNSATYDGTPARVSFYITSSYSYNKNLFEEMVTDGHEVGNHTINHKNGGTIEVSSEFPPLNYSVAQWETEMNGCKNFLINEVGASQSDVAGFRIPFLSYNGNCFEAIKNTGMIYDCSLHGNSWGGDGSNYNWPYTLDGGSPGQTDAGTHPGVWEVPTHYVVKTDGSKITGLDYNMIEATSVGGAAMTKSEMLATLKYTLEMRYNGNRAPMTFGAHSHYYAEGDNCPNITYQERQQVLSEFFNYALSKPDVRVVSSIDIIKWMRNPSPLNDTTIIDTTDPSESLIEIAGWEADADEFGSTVDTGNAIINSGVMKVSFNQVAQPDSTKWPWVAVTAYTDENGKFDNVKWIKITYKCDKSVSVSLPQPPLSEEGTSYQKEIPASTSWKTELLRIADFKQPDWVTITTPLDLTVIHDVMFTPVIAAETGGTATLEINEVILYGYEEAVAIAGNFNNNLSNELSVNKVTPDHMNISVSDNGMYTLSIFSVDGKQIKTFGNQYFTSGSHTVAWNGDAIGTKLYLIVLQGKNVKAVKKALIH